MAAGALVVGFVEAVRFMAAMAALNDALSHNVGQMGAGLLSSSFCWEFFAEIFGRAFVSRQPGVRLAFRPLTTILGGT
jgi:hypothetical protein